MSDKTDTNGANPGHVREMSATETLRRLLDERGVEWEDHDGVIERRTVYMTPNGWCYVSTANDKWLSYVEYHDMTPAQAIDATLGRGTCRRVCTWDNTAFTCSECGGHCDSHQQPRYCPNCGRQVVE